MNQPPDFTVRVIKRTPTKQEQIKKGSVAVEKKFMSDKNVQKKTDVNLKLIEEERITLPKATLELGKTIQKGRTEKKLSQEQLAKICGFKKEIIRDYEKGVAIAKKSELDKISKALGIKLNMPKTKKIVG